MSSTQKNFALPLAFIGIMFFAIGFALGINSVLIPVLQGSLGITSAESYLIIAATFVPFLIFGYPASMTIKAIGYKHTMALSFAMFAVAFGLYIPSASQESFPLFLVASFVSGTANAFLQASVNPYITILGPLDSAAKRISKRCGNCHTEVLLAAYGHASAPPSLSSSPAAFTSGSGAISEMMPNIINAAIIT